MALTPNTQPADIYLEWNDDLQLTASGSISLSFGWDHIRQRIVRRFLTNPAQRLPDGSSTPADYVFSPSYGIGAGALIDQNPTEAWIADLKRRMRQAVLSDAGVDPGAVPNVVITKPRGDAYQIFVNIKLISGQNAPLTLTVGPYVLPPSA